MRTARKTFIYVCRVILLRSTYIYIYIIIHVSPMFPPAPPRNRNRLNYVLSDARDLLTD